MFARVIGYLFDRIKQPAVIGEIIAGLFLGIISSYILFGQQYTIYNINLTIPNLTFNTPEFELLAEFGILFLLFISGLETRISKIPSTRTLGQAGKRTADRVGAVAAGGAVVVVVGVGRVGHGQAQVIVVGNLVGVGVGRADGDAECLC